VSVSRATSRAAMICARASTRSAPARSACSRLVRDNQSPRISAELASSPETGRATTMGQVETAIGSEIALLVELRNAAVELSQTLTQSIYTLRARAERRPARRTLAQAIQGSRRRCSPAIPPRLARGSSRTRSKLGARWTASTPVPVRPNPGAVRPHEPVRRGPPGSARLSMGCTCPSPP
jgi:hypothetical protein